jgi:hypothetical protein
MRSIQCEAPANCRVSHLSRRPYRLYANFGGFGGYRNQRSPYAFMDLLFFSKLPDDRLRMLVWTRRPIGFGI